MENVLLNENDDVETHEEASHETNAAQEPNDEPAVALASEQGQERPTEKLLDLTPSSGGRLRRKNPKYLDYEKELCKKQPRKTPVKKSSQNGETPGKTPAKRGRPKKVAAPEADQDQEEINTPPHKSEKAPKKRRVGKKTRIKKTAKKSPAKGDGKLTVEIGCVESEQQETEPKKPKRKYVKKQVVQKEAPAESTAVQEDQEDTPIATEVETTPGGRPRRSAAKAAIKYLQSLAKEAHDAHGHLNSSGSQPDSSNESPSPDPPPASGQKSPKAVKARGRRKKKKHPGFESDNLAEDEDFVPDDEEQVGEEMEEEEERESEWESDPEHPTGRNAAAASYVNRSIQGYVKHYGKAANGLPNYIMRVAIDSAKCNKKFREEHCSSWVFPEWIPSVKHWHIVQESDRERYLPQELRSAGFKVFREGLCKKEATPMQRLSRFESLPAHPERWDMFMFAGGPVWAMEWCPTPDGITADQYVALACHQRMDDQHFANRIYAGPGLIQLWDLGRLEYDIRPETPPSLSYCLAQNKGFVWQLKWCPAGAWELPTCERKVPFLPRLGLLAAATSTGVVTIYSMPHPDVLNSSKMVPDSGELTQGPPIYKAEGVITLKLGSLKSPRPDKSGQVLSMDWVFDKPHNIMAVGFYDGLVGLWDLSSRSAMLCVHEPDNSITLFPYRCFFAHDNAVRALAFCPASRYLLVTAGDDRLVKTWDLKRLYEPNTVQKRNLTTEVYWPLNSPGIFLSQESTYSTYRQQGVHYYDLGYYNIRSLFVIPRTSTMWSISFTDWLNGLVTSDTLGEVIFALPPELATHTQTFRRVVERRFVYSMEKKTPKYLLTQSELWPRDANNHVPLQPVFFTDMVPYETNTTEEESCDVEDVEEMGTTGEQENVRKTEGAHAGAEGERESHNTPGEVTVQGEEENASPSIDVFLQSPQTYKEAAKKYYLHYTDSDMLTFNNYLKRAPWKRMCNTEVNSKSDLDLMPLAALHKVRFNPNMSSHTWVVSAGQAGLVRVHCLKSMNNSDIQKMIDENKAQYNAQYLPEDTVVKIELTSSPQAVHSTTEQQ
ncbi:general transcription factor 3C polypeptide 2 [Lampris incognitus]|uniref:general transcription factor 3C polypeptide 2 n=1 Tax=Lampris incognitus TaxID=2546036 RepID=UPI0024B5164F|nr:general transcription factor 3C polypeptide 2 [Lampris incognitus]